MYVNFYGCSAYPSVFYTDDPSVGVTQHTGAVMLCTHPTPAPLLTMLYFMSYVTITAFCIVPLFIGAVSISMADCVVEMKEEQKRMHRIRCMEKLDEQVKLLENPSRINNKTKKAIKLVELAFRGENIAVDMRKLRGRPGSTLFRLYKDFAAYCADLVESNAFQSVATGVILCAGLVVGMQTDRGMLVAFGYQLNLANNVIQYCFTIEMALKIISEGEHPYMYFNSGWNCFDAVVVIGSWMPSAGNMIIILRLLRLFRVLKLMRAFPQLQVIITGASKGLSAGMYILAIVGLVYYFFAILGQLLFASNDPGVFGQIHIAMIVLFDIATLDNWTSYFYPEIYGCATQPPLLQFNTAQCNHPNPQFWIGVIYFVIFTIFGSYVLLSLFVGSIGMAMDEANEEEAENVRILKHVAAIKDTLNLQKWIFLFYGGKWTRTTLGILTSVNF